MNAPTARLPIADRAPTLAALLSWLLLLTASLATEFAVVRNPFAWLEATAGAVGWLIAAAAVRRWLGRSARVRPAAVVLMFAAAGAVWAWARLGDSPPVEVALLVVLRNLGLGVSAAGGGQHPRADDWRAPPGAVAVGVFVLIVAALLIDETLRFVVVTLASAVGGAWLCLRNAEHRRRGAFATGLGVAAALAVVAAAAHAWIGGTRTLFAFEGWLPSSGGSRQASLSASSGVGEAGEDEARGDGSLARAVGFDDADVFLNSDLPGLYDAFIEAFGEPMPAGEPQRKMIGLKRDQIVASRETSREDLSVGRQFSIRRSPAQRHRPTDDQAPTLRPAAALLWVKASHPLHLPMQVFDRFDGESWHARPDGVATPPIRVSPVDRRLELVDVPRHPALTDSTQVRVRVGRFRHDVVPLAPLTASFRLGRVDKPGFFRTRFGGLVALLDRPVPAGAVADSHALLVRRDARHLGEAWSGVEAIVQEVRRGGAVTRERDPLIQSVDHASTVPSAAAELRAAFLRSRRGPAYLFATEAADRLRQAGYHVRLVTGFYFDPSRGEASGEEYAPLTADDVHAWLEVRVDGATTAGGQAAPLWVTVDPSPGFAVASAGPSWSERLAASALAGWHWARARAVAGLIGVAALALAWCLRHRAVELVATAVWRGRLALADHPRAVAVATLRLLEGRARRAGNGRPPHAPPGDWVRSLARGSPEVSALAALLNRALYGPPDPSGDKPLGRAAVDPIRALCQRAVLALDVTALRRRGRPFPRESAGGPVEVSA